jgi:integrase
MVGKTHLKPASIETKNLHLQAVKSFAQWMVRDGRAAESPLAHLQGGNAAKDPKRVRRALSDEECAYLLAGAPKAGPMYGMTGEARALMYSVILETGLRQNEVRTLTPGACDLEGDPPTVTVKAAYAKAGRADDLPVRPSTAARLATFIKGMGADEQIFPLPANRKHVIAALRADLDAGRGLWIEAGGTEKGRAERAKTDFLQYIDRAGRFADFHALRHTFASSLAKAGTPPKIAMDLLRHTDINLTMRTYSHSIAADRAQAITALPEIKAAEIEPAEGSEGKSSKTA